jgi:hypothetical protein
MTMLGKRLMEGEIMQSTFKTPEFWATVIGQVIGIAVLCGGLTSEQGTALQQSLQTIVGGVLSILTLFGYIKAQSVRKAAAAAIMIARIQKHGGDPVRVLAGAALDADVQKLLAQL